MKIVFCRQTIIETRCSRHVDEVSGLIANKVETKDDTGKLVDDKGLLVRSGEGYDNGMRFWRQDKYCSFRVDKPYFFRLPCGIWLKTNTA